MSGCFDSVFHFLFNCSSPRYVWLWFISLDLRSSSLGKVRWFQAYWESLRWHHPVSWVENPEGNHQDHLLPFVHQCLLQFCNHLTRKDIIQSRILILPCLSQMSQSFFGCTEKCASEALQIGIRCSRCPFFHYIKLSQELSLELWIHGTQFLMDCFHLVSR